MGAPGRDIEAGLAKLEERYRQQFARSQTEPELRAQRAELLGKKGALTAVLRSMGQIPKEQRRALGEKVNALRSQVEQAFDTRLAQLRRAQRRAELDGPPWDLTLPGRRPVPRGHNHPITRVKNEILDIFSSLGFAVSWGPEVELEANNFSKLACLVPRALP